MQLARLRRFIVLCALAALTGVLSLTLAQCTLVSDSLTGLQPAPFASTTCAGQCRDAYRDALSAARKIHQRNLSACKDQPDPQACTDAENARWDQVQADLMAQEDTCIANCHKQGTGSAG